VILRQGLRASVAVAILWTFAPLRVSAEDQGGKRVETTAGAKKATALQVLRQERARFLKCRAVLASAVSGEKVVLNKCGREKTASASPSNAWLTGVATEILAPRTDIDCDVVTATVFFQGSETSPKVLIDDTRVLALAGLGLTACPSDLESVPAPPTPCKATFGPGPEPAKK
jgi:hypothetical protein